MKNSIEETYRLGKIIFEREFPVDSYRTPWRRDYARLIHSPSFRRLQGKTQLFPGFETDFFRNRLTHSLEVAQISKTIAIKLNNDLKKNGYEQFINPDVAEFAGLAHDIGHPPFGHFGEEVLDRRMKRYGGFEGNAQTLRLLARCEKKHLIPDSIYGFNKTTSRDERVGLNLTVRSLASILKYDKKIPKFRNKSPKPIKGYYYTESDLVSTIKEKLTGKKTFQKSFKTIECQIMDIADDIAYSTYDLEDSLKAGFIKPTDLISSSLYIVAAKVSDCIGKKIGSKEVRDRMRSLFDIFAPPFKIPKGGIKIDKKLYESIHFYSIETANNFSKMYSEDGYYRTHLTSKLVGMAVNSVSIKKVDRNSPILSTVELDEDKRIDVEILKRYVYEFQILSQKVQMIARRSKEIIGTIFDVLANEDEGYMLLPEDFKQIYLASKDANHRMRTVCDFIACMTDRYAVLEFYCRLKSENPQTIFKPV
ncbi:MAG: dGTP triphosphohydrolase [Sedimentisphaerales bacterium]